MEAEDFVGVIWFLGVMKGGGGFWGITRFSAATKGGGGGFCGSHVVFRGNGEGGGGF